MLCFRLVSLPRGAQDLSEGIALYSEGLPGVRDWFLRGDSTLLLVMGLCGLAEQVFACIDSEFYLSSVRDAIDLVRDESLAGWGFD